MTSITELREVDSEGEPSKRPRLASAVVEPAIAGASSSRSGSCSRADAGIAVSSALVCEERHEEEEEGKEESQHDDREYFGSYDDIGVHALMLGDQPRVGAYCAALRAHRSSLEGRVILDVGAGSGILSLLAARHSGAARVYAVEAAPNMARLARELVKRNGLDDIVKIVEGRVEDVELPEKVDAIVSEWMGFYLLHESMLDSVIVARERWLKPGGLMLPSSARIWAAPVDAEDLRQEIVSYDSLYGVDVSPIGEVLLAHRCSEPQVEKIEPSRLLGTPVLAVDLGSLTELQRGATREFVAAVDFVTLRKGHAAALAFWFDVGFGPATSFTEAASVTAPSQEVVLSTGPGAPGTHWKQTLVYLGVFAEVEAGESLSAQVTFLQSKDNYRQYAITIET